jgi:SAM-dependent methyltransferase
MFRLTFDEHGNGRDDILLTIGQQRLRADSYYFAIDRGGDASAGPKVTIAAMLGQWKTAVAACPKGASVYLPFDLSDEHTGWVRCAVGDTCELRAGFAPLEGYKVWPDDWDEWQRGVPGFIPSKDAPPLTMDLDRVLAAIDASIAGLEHLAPPSIDPTPLFDLVRGNFATELLAAAACHFDLFTKLDQRSQTREQLAETLGISLRAVHVLVTAMAAMGTLTMGAEGKLLVTPLGRMHLIPGRTFDMTGYIGLVSQTPGVLEMVARLKSSRPTGSDDPGQGAAFIARDGLTSAMDRDDDARRLTLSLAGRARIVAPALAERMDLAKTTSILDVAGGSGLYSIALLKKFPKLTATVFDREPVLKVAQEFAERHGVSDRLKCVAGDMFRDPWPACDAVLLSNVLHDWDVPECHALTALAAKALKPEGRMFIHDVLLDDDLCGPLPIALYSAALFGITEGRAYSRAEYESYARPTGLHIVAWQPTTVNCHVLEFRRK